MNPKVAILLLFLMFLRAFAAEDIPIGLPYTDSTTEQMGVVNGKGSVVVMPHYDEIGPDHNGLLPFLQNGSWGYMSPDGTIVVKPSFQTAFPLQEGYGRVCRADKWGYIDKHGRSIIPCIYHEAWDMHQGYCLVEDAQGRHILDKSGTTILTSTTQTIMSVGDNLVATRGEQGWYFTDMTGKSQITGPFDDVSSFNEGFAAVEVKHKWGYIDTHGKLVIPATWDHARPIHDGRGAICLDQKWGFVDTKGTECIPHQYKAAMDFSEGLAVVSKDGQTAIFIRQTGEALQAGPFDDAEPFDSGYALVVTGEITGYIDSAGTFIFKTHANISRTPEITSDKRSDTTPEVTAEQRKIADDHQKSIYDAACKGDHAAEYEWYQILIRQLTSSAMSTEAEKTAEWNNALEYLKKSAQGGNSNAQSTLGYMELTGIKNGFMEMKAKERDGVALISSAANANNSMACWQLGIAYMNGLGVKKDYTISKEMFQKCIDLGDAEGFVYMGELYEFGFGVPKDVHQAEGWYIKAIHAGGEARIEAQLCLDAIHGVPPKVDP